MESFFEAFDADSDNTTLSSPDIFGNRTLSDISFDSSDEEIKNIISTKIDESIVSAFEVLRKRIDKFGVTQPNIQRLGTSGRILVELPGAKDIDRVKKLLQSTAQLEFWTTEKNIDFFPFLNEASKVVKDLVDEEKKLDEKEKTTSEIDDFFSPALLSKMIGPSSWRPAAGAAASWGRAVAPCRAPSPAACPPDRTPSPARCRRRRCQG